MSNYNRKIFPVLRDMREFEKILKGQHEVIVFLDTRVSQMESLVKAAHEHDKKVFVHADLVKGLKADEYGIEYLIRNVKADGIISTRGNAIAFAKKNKVLGILRLFALDSYALDNNLKLCSKIEPDYIEVLPGVVPDIVSEVHSKTGIPVIAGGLIRSKQDVINALENGAIAVSTSNPELWNL